MLPRRLIVARACGGCFGVFCLGVFSDDRWMLLQRASSA